VKGGVKEEEEEEEEEERWITIRHQGETTCLYLGRLMCRSQFCGL
jgi:hypothetical protein